MPVISSIPGVNKGQGDRVTVGFFLKYFFIKEVIVLLLEHFMLHSQKSPFQLIWIFNDLYNKKKKINYSYRRNPEVEWLQSWLVKWLSEIIKASGPSCIFCFCMHSEMLGFVLRLVPNYSDSYSCWMHYVLIQKRPAEGLFLFGSLF